MSFQYVTIYYGPCDSFHSVVHKPQKLRGLKDKLQRLGYRVDLEPVLYVNYCMLEVCGHEVFRCNIQNLLFNTPYDKDPVCQRAVRAVQLANTKLQRARTYMWIWRQIEDQLFLRSEFGPKDHWPLSAEELPPLNTCLACVHCCGILVKKKT